MNRNRAIADPRREEKNKKPTFIERIPDNVQKNISKYWKSLCILYMTMILTIVISSVQSRTLMKANDFADK